MRSANLSSFTAFYAFPSRTPFEDVVGESSAGKSSAYESQPGLNKPLDMANGDPHNVVLIIFPRACKLHKITGRLGYVQSARTCTSWGGCPVSCSSLIRSFAFFRTWLRDLESNVVCSSVDWGRIWVVFHINSGSMLESF